MAVKEGVKVTQTLCKGCANRCGVLVHSDADGNIVRIEGDPDHPFTKGVLCASGLSQRFIHKDKKRVIYPMRRVGERGSGEWERISWDEAMKTIIDKTKEIKETYGPESIVVGQGTSRTTNDWHTRLNETIGNHGWDLAPLHVCLNPMIVPNALTLGIPQPSGADVLMRNNADFRDSKTIVLWGVGVHSLLTDLKNIRQAQEQGSRVICIDPRFNELAMFADIHVRPRPGTDGALAMACMNVIIEERLYDADWIDKWTYGFDELAERVKTRTPEWAEEITGVSADTIREIARMKADGPTVMVPMLGANCMHTNAIQSGRALTCLQALVGPIDQKGGFLASPNTGSFFNPNVTLWGPEVNMLDPESKVLGAQDYPAFAQLGGSQWPGAVWRAILTEKPWPVKMLVLVASDPLMCYEDPQTVSAALQSPNLELFVVKDFYITPSAQYADIILPTESWSECEIVDEECSAGNITPSSRAVEAPGECKNDHEFYLAWGKGLNPELWPWENSREMLLWKYKDSYGIDMTWDEYVNGGIRSTEWDVRNRTYLKHEKGMLRPDGQPGFNTPTGRVEFYCASMIPFGYDPLPDYTEPAESPVSTPSLAEEYPLIYNSGFRLYSFFHSAWTNVPQQRSLYPYPFAIVHPEDAATRGISDGEWIEIESPRGTIKVKAHVTFEALKGVVSVPRPGWKQECEELGLPGYGWEGACPNVLVPAEPCDPSYGSAPMRSLLCEIRKVDE